MYNIDITSLHLSTIFISRYPPKFHQPRVPVWGHQTFDSGRGSNSEDNESPTKDRNKVYHDTSSNSKYHQYRPYPSRPVTSLLKPNYSDGFNYPNFNLSSNIQIDAHSSENDSFSARSNIPHHSVYTPPRIPHDKNSYYGKKTNRNQYSERNQYDHSKKFTPDTSKYLDTVGLRPPSSDYFENSAPLSDDSKTFTRSVDDTVNIIRERLISRRNSTSAPTATAATKTFEENDSQNNQYQSHDIQPKIDHKSKAQKPKNQKVKASRKIKNKIISQLFKMDKSTIHKLLDNPKSSSKFEYAINSLITESQNSFNRYARAAAEKSLFTGGHIQYNENDTIYEDTFMKQMQCVLNPQEKIMLSDLKPIVMAELNKFLSLDEYVSTPSETINDDTVISSDVDVKDFQYNESCSYEEDRKDYALNFDESREYNIESIYNFDDENMNYKDVSNDNENTNLHNGSNFTKFDDDFNMTENIHETDLSQTPLSNNNFKRKRSISEDKRRHSINISDESLNTSSNVPLFEGSTEPLSENEDPFAELDKQYHVAVDPNLIDTEFSRIESIQTNENLSPDNCTPKLEIKSETIETTNTTSTLQTSQNDSSTIIFDNPNIDEVDFEMSQSVEDQQVKDIATTTPIKPNKDIVKKSRKRPPDEPVAHRKERRKKTGIEKMNNQTPNKNVRNNDSLPKSKEKCDTKSILKLLITKNDDSGVTREFNQDISYSDKYVKRKEEDKKLKSSKKLDLLKKEQNASLDLKNPVETKENTNKFKTFDMFEQKTRKVQIHQAPRNTAQIPDIKVSLDEKNKDKIENKPCNAQKHTKGKRSVATQVIKKMISKTTQTISSESESKNKSVQTDDNHNQKTINRTGDVFERMKEIDLEIQILLQEKFKLYNSLESKDTSEETLQNLGMAVLNVTPFGDPKSDITNDNICEDAMIDNITQLSEVELEEIALEGIETTVTIPADPIPSTPETKITNNKRVCSSTSSKSKKYKKRRTNTNLDLNEEIVEDATSQYTPKKNNTSPIKTRRRRNLEADSNEIKDNTTISPEYLNFIKPCSVILIKTKLKELMKNVNNNINNDQNSEPIENMNQYVPETCVKTQDKTANEIVPVINEFHFQDDVMLISEDIVIDDNCEDDIPIDSDGISVLANEEVVDNSSAKSDDDQVSSDINASLPENTCRTFDMSVDEEMRKDTITVTGNSDAVLAIEVKYLYVLLVPHFFFFC